MESDKNPQKGAIICLSKENKLIVSSIWILHMCDSIKYSWVTKPRQHN